MKKVKKAAKKDGSVQELAEKLTGLGFNGQISEPKISKYGAKYTYSGSLNGSDGAITVEVTQDDLHPMQGNLEMHMHIFYNGQKVVSKNWEN